jgi:cyanate lyase
MTSNEAVTARVVDELERLRWSRADLARAIGHERAWVTRKLNGSRRWSVDDLDTVGRALGLSPAELLLETVCGQLGAPAWLGATPALGCPVPA